MSNMSKRALFICLVLASIAFWASSCCQVRAEEALSAKEIVKRSDDLMRGDTASGTYRMSVTTPEWSRTLDLTATTKGRDRSFIRITSPAKEAGITTLRIGTNMWNYLPKVERTVKIPPSMMLQPWMGSDFTNDDLVKESSIVADYTHRIVAKGPAGPDEAYTIELLPLPKAAVAWGRLLHTIRSADFVPLKYEFYDEHGTLIKTEELTAAKKMSDRVIPTVWTMSSALKKGHKTVIEVLDVTYNGPVDESTFTLENLKRR